MSTKATHIPAGTEFFDGIFMAETKCMTAAKEDLPSFGINAPACYEVLGTVLSILYSEAACLHGCQGGDHFWPRMTARIVSHSLAALRLAMVGYYDEALALTRNLAEAANLLFLFCAKRELLQQWRSATEADRWKNFRPAKVRDSLDAMGLRPPVDDSRYSLLCGVGVHLVPSTAPQALDPHDRPSLGAKYKYDALVCVVNELGLVVSECAGCLSLLLQLGDRREELQAAAQTLLAFVGKLDLASLRAFQRPN